MDNVTHSLVGWTLGETGLKRKSRKGLAALILGANMPDIDVFLGWVPWGPLATHRGWTHSLVGGVLLMPPLLAGLLWGLDRWQVRRGQRFRSGLEMHFGWLMALSYLGTLTHPLLDWQTSYAIQLFTPFDRRWYHTDTLFILDPWIWLGLGTAIWMSRRRERARARNWGRPAFVAAVGLIAYVGANGALTTALRNGLKDDAPDMVVMSPPPVMFWQRELILRWGHLISRAHYDPFGPPPVVSNPINDGMDNPVARRALLRPEMLSFRRWSIMPMARVARGRCHTLIQLQDARFGNPGEGRLGRAILLPTGAPGC
jgi:inner membrane protein